VRLFLAITLLLCSLLSKLLSEALSNCTLLVFRILFSNGEATELNRELATDDDRDVDDDFELLIDLPLDCIELSTDSGRPDPPVKSTDVCSRLQLC
jgi:hypothetical protein